jgi:CubicO group peptidase (beta-lactamase class C family)
MFSFTTASTTSVLLLSTLLTVASAQTSTQISTQASVTLDPKALDRFMAQEMKNHDVPGVGLAIVENGKIIYVHGYGVADVATGRPADGNTQFAIGSVTKSFTALGIMRLVDQGAVKLDTPVIRYLPEFRLSDPEATRTVTVRNLLTHTSGLTRDDTGLLDPDFTVAQVIASAAKTPLVGKPGKTYVYSNVNAILAGEIISRVSGRSWEAFTRDEILRPLGMAKTSFTEAAMKATGNFATPHTLDVLSGLKATPFYALGGRAAAGALNASPAEMARYLQFQLGNGKPLISQKSLNALHTRFIRSDDANVGGLIGRAAAQTAKAKGVKAPPALITNNGYAFFWGTETFQGQSVVEHGGNTDGFTANVSLLPGRRSGVVIMTNNEHADYFIEAVRQHVLQALLGTRPAQDTSAILQAQLRLLGADNVTRKAQIQAARGYKASAQELQALAGPYTSLVGGGAPQVTVTGQTLRLRADLQGVKFDLKLLPIGDNQFLSNSQPAIGSLLNFARAKSRQTVSLVTAFGNVPLGERTVKQK